MRVLVVTAGTDVPRDQSIVSRRLPALLASLRGRGVDPTIVTLADAAGLRARYGNAGVRALSVRAPGLLRLPVAVWRVLRLLRTEPFDVVEGAEPVPAIVAGLAARAAGRRPIVYRRHHAAGGRRLRVASRAAAMLADWTVVSCEANRLASQRDDGTSADRVLIAPSGVAEHPRIDDATVAALRDELGIGDAPIVVAVARLRAEKGIDVAIEALAGASDGPVSRAHLVVVGSGPEEDALRAQAEALLGHRAHVVGHRDDVAEFLALADVAVMPSRRESVGQVTLEILAARTPFVGSAVGGIADTIVDGVHGLLVPPDDPNALCAALDRVLGDPGLAERLADAGYHRFRSGHTIEAMAGHWHAAWSRVLEATAGVA